MSKQHSFTRKEIAILLDMIEMLRLINPDTRKARGMTEAKIRQLYFKLYRIL